MVTGSVNEPKDAGRKSMTLFFFSFGSFQALDLMSETVSPLLDKFSVSHVHWI